jgi:hypothetical protein
LLVGSERTSPEGVTQWMLQAAEIAEWSVALSATTGSTRPILFARTSPESQDRGEIGWRRQMHGTNVLVVQLAGQPYHFSFVSSGSRFEAIPGTDCVFANGLVARDVSGGPRYEPHRRTLFENRRTGTQRCAACGNDSPTESSGSSPVRSDLVLLSRRAVVAFQANRIML